MHRVTRCVFPQALAFELFATDRFRSLFLRLRADGFELISAKPFIMRHPSFLSEQHCKLILAAAEPRFRPSMVSGEQKIDLHTRSSYSTIVKNPALQLRLMRLVGNDSRLFPQSLNVVRYTKGQRFVQHHDSDPRRRCMNVANLHYQRPFTFFAYLNDVDEKAGGATTFPLMKPLFKQQPRQGVCLFWANWGENYQLDQLVEHRAEPVLADVTKYAMNMFIEERQDVVCV